MRVHLYDFRWVSPESFEFQASHQGRFGRKQLSLGADIALEITSETHCGGSMRENVWKKCPHEVPGKKRCEYCRAREGSFIFTAFDGFDQSHVTGEDLARIQGEHVVYLAWFGAEMIKIGVSKIERQALRQIEQGTYATLFLAQTPDGVSARQIETLFRRSGLVDKIKMSQKKNLLLPEEDDKSIHEALLTLLGHHKKCLAGEFSHLEKFILANPVFMTWSDVFGLNQVRESGKPFHAVDLKKDDWVSGKVIAVRGAFLMIETPDEIIACNAKDLLGRDIDFTPRDPGLGMSQALQGALF